MTISCILFALAALIWPLGRMMRKTGAALPFFSVLLCCAGAGLYILSGGSVSSAAAGVAAVAFSALLTGEGGGKQ